MSSVATRAYKSVHEQDPKTVIFDALKGYLDKVEPNGQDYMICVYERPEKLEFKSGAQLLIPATASRRAEDKFQGTVGLIVKAGPNVGTGAERFTDGRVPEVGDWVAFRNMPNEAIPFTLGDRAMRLVQSEFVRFTLTDPDCVI